VTIRLYTDEDSMSHALVRALRARGVDVTTALDEGMIEREDAEHLDYATEQGRVLYSFNITESADLNAEKLQEGIKSKLTELLPYFWFVLYFVREP